MRSGKEEESEREGKSVREAAAIVVSVERWRYLLSPFTSIVTTVSDHEKVTQNAGNETWKKIRSFRQKEGFIKRDANKRDANERDANERDAIERDANQEDGRHIVTQT